MVLLWHSECPQSYPIHHQVGGGLHLLPHLQEYLAGIPEQDGCLVHIVHPVDGGAVGESNRDVVVDVGVHGGRVALEEEHNGFYLVVLSDILEYL